MALIKELTQWTNSETPNSDVVNINEALERQVVLLSQAFEESNIPSSDLQWTSRQLRDAVSVLMMEKPSKENSEQSSARIKEIVIRMVHKIKEKHSMLRSNGENWNREVPLAAALSRGNNTSSSRLMSYPSSSPPLPPITSPRMTNEEIRGRNSLPGNDLSATIVPRRSYSPSPQPLAPLPTKSTSATRRGIPIPQPSVVNPSPPRNTSPQLISVSARHTSFDENDLNTAGAFAALKKQENLARRSSVRRASMYRGDHIAPSRQQDSAYAPQSQKSQLFRTLTEEKRTQGLTLFLQIGKQTRKTTYQGEMSIPALSMLFVEIFSYSPYQSDFPSIYIRDSSTGIFYELTDTSEVKNNSVLSLNTNESFAESEQNDQKNLVSQLSGSFQKKMEDMAQVFTDKIEQIKQQFEVSHEVLIQRIDVCGKNSFGEDTTTKQPDNQTSNSISTEQLNKQLLEIETLKHEIAVLRQTEHETKNEMNQLVLEMKTKAEHFSKSKPEKESKIVAARIGLEKERHSLLDQSEKTTNRLEDLQDTIDQLNLDLTERKSRPSEAQMNYCAKERETLLEEINCFKSFIAQVKPRWKRTWEYELQVIVKEQQDLKENEFLLDDIKDDFEALSEVLEQIEKIRAYQINNKPTIREFRTAPAEEGFEGMSSVLQQVSTIDVDHERRLRAMEHAEKMRQREIANRVDEFEKELISFVDNKKLKRTGGALEIDRLRKLKDEEMIRQNYVPKPKRNADGYIEEEES
ncbi:actin interacting protein 3-domain-containing protein [Sporodiniella umbellata]|nr:actin interacting protein 3-domain-containing protein [Sporodiniella umbellata]